MLEKASKMSMKRETGVLYTIFTVVFKPNKACDKKKQPLFPPHTPVPFSHNAAEKTPAQIKT